MRRSGAPRCRARCPAVCVLTDTLDLSLCGARQLQADTRETEITLLPDENNIYRWVGFLQARGARASEAHAPASCACVLTMQARVMRQGPTGTPYEGGTFQVALTVPEQYPLTPPQVKFVTKARGAAARAGVTRTTLGGECGRS